MNNNLKHKVGDKVRIVAQNKEDDHLFKIGEEVIITNNSNYAVHDYIAESSCGGIYYIDECACEAIETPKIKYRLKEECRKYEQAVSEIAKILPPMLFDKGSRANEHLDKAGVMHWFEPVYEEPEFTAKKGEWVVITDFGKANPGRENPFFKIGVAYQLFLDLSPRTGFYIHRIIGDQILDGCNNAFELGMKFRHATPSEISKAKEGETVIIKMSCNDKNGNDDSFEIEVSKKGIYYKPEKAWLDIFGIRTSIGMKKVCNGGCAPYTFKPVIIDAGCKLSTLVSDWEKVLSEYERICKG